MVNYDTHFVEGCETDYNFDSGKTYGSRKPRTLLKSFVFFTACSPKLLATRKILTRPAHCIAPGWNDSSRSSEARLLGKPWRNPLGWTEKGFASVQEDLFVRSRWCGTPVAALANCRHPEGGFALDRASMRRSWCCQRYQTSALADLDL